MTTTNDHAPLPIASNTHPASFTALQMTDVLLHASALPKWQQEYVQLSEGAFNGEIRDISFGPLQLFRETMDKAVDQHGQPWENSFAVGVPVSLEGDGFWCGDRLEEDSIFFLKPNSELKFRTPRKSDIYVAVLDMQLLGAYAEELEELDARHISQLSGVTPAAQQLCARLRQSFSQVFDGISSAPGILDEEATRQALLSEILHSLCLSLRVLNDLQPHCVGQFVHRHIVEKAKEYILSRRSTPPSVLEICQELRISRRTLHYAFQKVLGVNPVTFLRYIRLHGARHELLSSPPGKYLISEIAARWGFWHSGMFCTYYKMLFGETPSTTQMRAAEGSASVYKGIRFLN
ncbi:transcriptional regulator EutR [compost metagenome]